MYTHTYIYIYIYMFFKYLYIYISIYLSIYLFVCILYIYDMIYVYIHTRVSGWKCKKTQPDPFKLPVPLRKAVQLPPLGPASPPATASRWTSDWSQRAAGAPAKHKGWQAMASPSCQETWWFWGWLDSQWDLVWWVGWFLRNLKRKVCYCFRRFFGCAFFERLSPLLLTRMNKGTKSSDLARQRHGRGNPAYRWMMAFSQ